MSVEGMTVASQRRGGLAGAPPAAGVTKANPVATRLERRIALVVVVTPVLGLVAAIALLWGYAVGVRELVLLAVMFSVGTIGIGVGFHRLISHRSFQTSAPMRVLLVILGSFAAQGPVLYWAAIHRRHHQFSDRAGDPHSPNIRGEGFREALRGLWHAHTGWLFVHEITDWGRWVPDLLRDRAVFKANQGYFWWMFLGLLVPAVAGGLWTLSWTGALLGFLWGGLVRMFLGHHATWSINSITHLWGSRPYQSRDYSRNNFLIALFTFGEGWHNNHHAFPTSARHGLEWWQIDINGLVIRALELLGLVWDVTIPSRGTRREASKPAPAGGPR